LDVCGGHGRFVRVWRVRLIRSILQPWSCSAFVLPGGCCGCGAARPGVPGGCGGR
jgi:hypothetical protein